MLSIRTFAKQIYHTPSGVYHMPLGIYHVCVSKHIIERKDIKEDLFFLSPALWDISAG